MPTRGRQAFAAAAVEYWRAQTYPHRELVIVDDQDKPSFPAGISGEGIQYHVLRQRLTIGQKRNIACSRAAGEIIAHFDDDDVSAPGRLADQYARLMESGKSVTSYSSMRFKSEQGWWLYSGAPGKGIGSSLMFRRDWWTGNAFVGDPVGEDGVFIARASAAGQLELAEARDLMYATIHPGNTSPRELKTPQWSKIS